MEFEHSEIDVTAHVPGVNVQYVYSTTAHCIQTHAQKTLLYIEKRKHMAPVQR